MASYRNKRSNGKWVTYHRWLVEQHLGRELRSDEVIHHKNHNREDNRLSNLEIMSETEHRKLHGQIDRHRWQKHHPSQKLTHQQVREIRALLAQQQMTQKEIANLYGVCQTTVYGIRCGRRWGWLK